MCMKLFPSNFNIIAAAAAALTMTLSFCTGKGGWLLNTGQEAKYRDLQQKEP